MRYPLVELLVGLLFLALGVGRGPGGRPQSAAAAGGAALHHLPPLQYWSRVRISHRPVGDALHGGADPVRRPAGSAAGVFPDCWWDCGRRRSCAGCTPCPVCDLVARPRLVRGRVQCAVGSAGRRVMGGCVWPVTGRRSVAAAWRPAGVVGHGLVRRVPGLAGRSGGRAGGRRCVSGGCDDCPVPAAAWEPGRGADI